MLKKIPVTDLRLGMHLHALDGPWLAHPFWRTKFVIVDEEDIRAIRASSVARCWIDLDKGLDVASVEGSEGIAAEGLQAHEPIDVEPLMSAADDPVPQPSTSFEDELERALRLCRQSKQAVQNMFAEARMGKAIDARAVQPLVDELAASVFRNPGALISLARLKTKDDYSYMHSVAVCALMVGLGREIGMSATACREAGLAGLLHDVGKAMMPLELLNKPGKLTEEEFKVMRSHPLRGHALLAEGGTAPESAMDVCLHHHERFDGSGYPHGLAGEAITPMARMAAICDVYDAVSSNRPYKSSWDPADSISRMASWNGHFDPNLFACFVRGLGIYPSGSLVRMRSGRLAVVVRQHLTDLKAPVVKVFFSTKTNMRIAVTQIDLSRPDAGDSIVSREPRGDWDFPQLDSLWAGEAARR